MIRHCHPDISSTPFRRSIVTICFVIVSCCAATCIAQEDAASPTSTPAPTASVDEAADNPPEGGANAEQPGFSFWAMIPLYLGLFLLWYLIVLRPQSNQKSRRAELLSNLKKNDKVITTGGIVGTVANVHESSGEVTVRSGDTAIRFQRESIREVVDETAAEATK